MRASVGASLSVLCGAAYAVLVEPEGAGRRPARRRVQAASVGASLSALCGAAYAVRWSRHLIVVQLVAGFKIVFVLRIVVG